MRSGTRLETRPDCVELFVREERTARYLHDSPNPGLMPLFAWDRRAVTEPCFEDGVSVWLGHSDLGGFDFGDRSSERRGLYRSEGVIARRGSQSVGLQHTCGCYTPDGRRLLTEVRTLRIQPGPAQGSMLDLRVELQAPDSDPVTLARSDRGLLRMRLASPFVSFGGTIRNSAQEYGADVNGRSAAWCGCVGVVQAETVGLVILDHPTNPAHPPVWNLDPSGTLEINPHFWQDTVIAAGKSVEFRYRLLIHSGYVEQGWADRCMRAFVAS
ncbi:MAG: Methane oxygenase PmoA [Chthonomonadaceae bacterium]|nr:Methane oxygenase PmoA [Chthonomonadaceae bacterium]